jgi:DNA-binding XRE family transcriptional regulator
MCEAVRPLSAMALLAPWRLSIREDWKDGGNPFGQRRDPCFSGRNQEIRNAGRVDWIRKRFEVTVLAEEPEDEFVSIESTEYWKEMEKNRVGNILMGARLKAGLTQAQLADKLGIRQNMVSDYERGRRTYSDAMAKRISKTLQVKEEHIKYGTEQ